MLVVDDNVDAAESERMLLEFAGHTVRVTHDGGAALALARTFRPDVVLLDIGMPGEDGYSVARKLRAEPGLGRPFIVAITGFGRQDDFRRSREAGFDMHLTKPVAPERLMSLIDSRPC